MHHIHGDSPSADEAWLVARMGGLVDEVQRLCRTAVGAEIVLVGNYPDTMLSLTLQRGAISKALSWRIWHDLYQEVPFATPQPSLNEAFVVEELRTAITDLTR